MKAPCCKTFSAAAAGLGLVMFIMPDAQAQKTAVPNGPSTRQALRGTRPATGGTAGSTARPVNPVSNQRNPNAGRPSAGGAGDPDPEQTARGAWPSQSPSRKGRVKFVEPPPPPPPPPPPNELFPPTITLTPPAWNDVVVNHSVNVGYVLEIEANGASTYTLVKGKLTWPEAKAAAEAAGGHLATITSQKEWDIVRVIPGASNVWLGGYQAPGSKEPAGGWAWVTGEPMTATAWMAGEPNDGGGGEHYMELIP